MDEVITLQFDGGSRGNPGPAGIGLVLSAADGTPLVTIGRFIGRATNNVAEYTALIAAMKEAKKLGARRIVIRGDSELIIKQMRGEYRVKHPDMRALHEQARTLLGEFEEAKILHNLRDKNELADRLANLAMDRRAEVSDADGAASGAARGPGTARAAAPVGARGGSTGESTGERADADDPAAPAVAAGAAGGAGEAADPPAFKRGDVFQCARCGCVVELRQPSSRRPGQLRPFFCQCGMAMRVAP